MNHRFDKATLALTLAIATALTVPLAASIGASANVVRTTRPAYAGTPMFGGRGGDLSPAQRGIAAYVPRLHPDMRDYGRIDPKTPVTIGLLMQVRNKPQLEALALAQSNPRTPYYHRYLTAAQFAATFAPTPQTYLRTIQTLQRRGFRITQTLPNRTLIGAVAPAAIAQRYFSTELHAVYQQKRGVRYTNVSPAIVPAELRGVVATVSGLHSITLVHTPIHFGNPAVIRNSKAYAQVVARVMAESAKARKLKMTVAAYYRMTHKHAASRPQPLGRRRFATPAIGMSTPPPGSEKIPTPEDPDTDYLEYYGYGPPVFSEGYDYPLQHGYGGYGHAAGSVIDVDYLESDMTMEYAAFLTPAGISRTGTTQAAGYRVCADPAATAACDGTIGQPDSDGEATLDAAAILTEAPYADFYEFIAPAFNDTQIEAAYAIAISQDKVDAVNSSFGGCETDDPAFEYAASYLGMEGAVLGITFSASSGDTGGFSCGTYASNGVPQTYENVSTPAAANYFVGIGGTSYEQITDTATNDYQGEVPWMYGGGGKSVLEAIPTWQQALVASAVGAGTAAGPSTTFRNVPDVSMVADPGTNPDGFFGGTLGGGLIICHNGALTDSGGTSLASPMFIAMQTDINDAQHSRNGFVNPSLYAIANTSTAEYDFAFNDITTGENIAYTAQTGFDDATGIGSPRGFELAGAPEYGTPGATAAPIGTPAPTASPTSQASSSPSSPPTSNATPHAVGTNFAVATLAGSMCAMSGASVDGKGNSGACLANPTGIQYVPAAAAGNVEQGETDPTIFFNDYTTGYLRGYDLTAATVTTYNAVWWNNATRSTKGLAQSDLFGLTYLPGAAPNGTTLGGLYEVSGGDESLVQIPLPVATPAAGSTPPASIEKALSGFVAAAQFDANSNDVAAVDSADTVLHIGVVAQGITDDTTASSALSTGNFGLTLDGATPANFVTVSAKTNAITAATDMAAMSTLTTLFTGTPINNPRQIVYVASLSAFFIANCGGNNIIRAAVTSATGGTDTIGAVTVVAGDGASRETDGKNTGAEFECPWGITTDNATVPSLYVTDQGGNRIRQITNLI